MYKPVDVVLPVIYGILLLILAILVWHFIHPVVSILTAAIGSYVVFLRRFFQGTDASKKER